MRCLLSLIVLIFALSIPMSVAAASVTYQPEDCEFMIDFPERPADTTRCNPDNPKQCFKGAVFNKVFSADSSVRITTRCSPAEKNMLETTTEDAMAFTVSTMAESSGAEDLQTGYNDHGDAKQAVAFGSSTLPDGMVSVYMGQLWIGKASVLTVEGEVKGPANPEADTIFSEIMRSIRPADQAEPVDKKAETEDKSQP